LTLKSLNQWVRVLLIESDHDATDGKKESEIIAGCIERVKLAPRNLFALGGALGFFIQG